MTAIGRNANLYSYYKNQEPAKPHLGIHLKDSTSSYRDICSAMFIAVLFIIPGTRNNLDVCQLMSG